MNFSIDQSVLLPAIGFADSIANGKLRQILGNVLIDATQGELIISATDLRVSLIQRVPCETNEEGKTCVDAKKLFRLVKDLPRGLVELAVEESWATVKAGKGKYKLPTTNTDEFPTMPDVPEVVSPMHAKTLTDLFDRSSYAVSTDESRIFLTGIFLRPGDGSLVAETTDGHRLVIAEEHMDSVPLDRGLIITPSGLNLAKKLFSGEIDVGDADGKLFLGTSKCQMFTTPIDASFPNTQQVWPETWNASAIVSRQELLGALKRVVLFSDSEIQSILVSVKNNSLTLSANNATGDEGSDVMDCALVGDGFQFAITAKYLAESMQYLGCQEVRLSFSGDLLPIRVEGVDVSGYDTIIMPLRLE